MKKWIKRIFKYFFLLLLIVIIIFLWLGLPIITGYGARLLCSAVFLEGRNTEDVLKHDLSSFPYSVARYTIDLQDSSATGSVLGVARQKAVYRKGLGSTLLRGIDENDFKHKQFNLATPPAVNQDTINWPMGNRIQDTLQAGVDKQHLSAAVDDAFNEGEHHTKHTRGVVVVYNGHIIDERYAPGFTANTPQLGWSMTKSIVNAMTGILVKQGKLNIHEPAPVPEWKNDERSKITIADLLQMSSGLKWWEFYFAPSNATNMLFKEKNMGLFAASLPLKSKPGTVFNYSSGTTNLLSYIIRRTLGDNAYYRFPYEELFYKIGMNSAIIETDAGGTFIGSSYCYATPRDWARFGLLYLNDGVWNGERILPEGWVKYTSTPTPAKNAVGKNSYGAMWWLNAGDTSKRKLPHVPADCFSCEGFGGQYVWVIPSKKLVVVRLGLDEGDRLDADRFLSMVIKALPQ